VTREGFYHAKATRRSRGSGVCDKWHSTQDKAADSVGISRRKLKRDSTSKRMANENWPRDQEIEKSGERLGVFCAAPGGLGRRRGAKAWKIDRKGAETRGRLIEEKLIKIMVVTGPTVQSKGAKGRFATWLAKDCSRTIGVQHTLDANSCEPMRAAVTKLDEGPYANDTMIVYGANHGSNWERRGDTAGLR